MAAVIKCFNFIAIHTNLWFLINCDTVSNNNISQSILNSKVNVARGGVDRSFKAIKGKCLL